MLGFLFKAPVKIVATFFVSLGLLLGAFVYFPGAFTLLQDLSNNLSDAVRDIPSDQQSRALWRTFTDSNAIFAVVMTILSRSIVEIFAQLFGLLFSGLRGGGNDRSIPRDAPVDI